MTRWVCLGLSCTLVFVAGCGSDDGDEDGSGGSTSSGGTSAGGSAGASTGGSSGASGSPNTGGQPNGCENSTLQAGNSNRKLTVGGVEREYNLHVPPNYDPTKPTPLVLNFHGYTSNMQQQEFFSMMSPKADAEGFIVAYPNGLKNSDGAQSWNAGFCCAFDDLERDDIGFVNAVIDDLQGAGCIDAKRVYATGMSNGGYMSHLLGCKLADRIAAIAPVAGVLGIPAAECQPSRPISVIHFHGTADTLVSYDAGFVSVPDTFAGWAERNGCTGSPTQTFMNGATTCDTYDSCDAGVSVTLCTSVGEGHCWPGQTLCPFGSATTDINADDEMWKLFEKTSLP